MANTGKNLPPLPDRAAFGLLGGCIADTKKANEKPCPGAPKRPVRRNPVVQRRDSRNPKWYPGRIHKSRPNSARSLLQIFEDSVSGQKAEHE